MRYKKNKYKQIIDLFLLLQLLKNALVVFLKHLYKLYI